MAAAHLEHLPAKACGGPVRHGEAAAGNKHPGHFCGYEVRTRREHGAKHRDHCIEAGAVVRKLLGVALVKDHREAFFRRALAGLGQQVRCNVDAGDYGSLARQRNGQVPGAAGNIENPRAWRERQAADESLRIRSHLPGQHAEVTRHPRGAHGGLDLLDGRCSHSSPILRSNTHSTL